MPNHYTNIIIVTQRDPYTESRASWLARLAEFAKCPFRAAIPESEDAKASAERMEPGLHPLWLREATAQWGTKWGGYNAIPPIELPGDCAAVLLVFCTAWDPGHAQAHAAIERYARERLGCATFAWVGLNPANDTAQAIRNITSR